MKSKKRDTMRTKILENIKKARILIDGRNLEISTRGTTLTPPNREVL